MYSHVVPCRLRRIALISAVLPLALLIGLRSAWAAYACRIDGEVRDACCCSKGATDGRRAPADSAPSIAATSCCDVTTGESTAGPQAHKTERAGVDDIALASVATATEVSVRSPVAVRLSWNAFARPPPRPVPLYLANRTILR